MEQIKFNHEASTMAEAFGITEDRKYEIEAYVLYALLSNEILTRKIYGKDKKDAPSNMRSKSGPLERVLDYALDEAELAYMTYEYATQDKFTDTPEGQLFASITAVKLEKDFGLDEEKFIAWWKEMRREVKKKMEKEI